MTYAEAAKELGIKIHIWKWGVCLGRQTDPSGKKHGWKLIRVIPLTGWIFDPHEIKEAIANDPYWRISYDQSQQSTSPDGSPSDGGQHG